MPTTPNEPVKPEENETIGLTMGDLRRLRSIIWEHDYNNHTEENSYLIIKLDAIRDSIIKQLEK